MANHVIGGFNVGPAKKPVAVFPVVFAYRFAITFASAINATTVGCLVARTLESGDVSGLK